MDHIPDEPQGGRRSIRSGSFDGRDGETVHWDLNRRQVWVVDREGHQIGAAVDTPNVPADILAEMYANANDWEVARISATHAYETRLREIREQTGDIPPRDRNKRLF